MARSDPALPGLFQIALQHRAYLSLAADDRARPHFPHAISKPSSFEEVMSPALVSADKSRDLAKTVQNIVVWLDSTNILHAVLSYDDDGRSNTVPRNVSWSRRQI
jgi:hypothetical protein